MTIRGFKSNTQYTMSSDVPITASANLYFGGLTTSINGVAIGQPKTMTSNDSGELQYIIFDNRDYTDDLLNQIYYIQLEEGTVATAYEPYKSSHLTADVPFRRVPNGVADKVYEADGQLWLEKNVEEYELQSADVTSLTTGVNVDWVVITKLNLTGYIYPTTTAPFESQAL